MGAAMTAMKSMTASVATTTQTAKAAEEIREWSVFWNWPAAITMPQPTTAY